MKRLLSCGLAVVGAVLVLASAGLFWSSWGAVQRETESARDTAPAGGRFVHAADVDVYIQEAGPDAGPVVLFVHGSGAWSGVWGDSMSTLAAAGFRAVAIDLPPFGYSQRPASTRYRIADQARRIVGVLDALGVDQATLVGHSFGGGPTAEAAMLAPNRVRKLVLVDAALSISDAPTPAPPALPVRAVLAFSPLRNALVAAFLTNPRFTRRLLQGFIANPRAASDRWVEIYQRPLGVQGSTQAVSAWLPELVAPAQKSASESPAAYAKLTMPVELIWGDMDTITPLSQAQHLASLLPTVPLTMLDGIGHIPQIEDGARFGEALLHAISTPSRIAP